MKRGDVVISAEGKPRPGVIVQADTVATPADVLLCPFSTTIIDAPIFRLNVDPDALNGLKETSQLMADKVGPVRRSRISGVVGRLGEADMIRLDDALIILLGLNSP